MIDTGLVFNANEVKPPSLTATWLERMSESPCSCEIDVLMGRNMLIFLIIILTTGTDEDLFALSNRRAPGMTMLASLKENDALANRSLMPPGNIMSA